MIPGCCAVPLGYFSYCFHAVPRQEVIRDCVRLATPGGPISEDSGIVAIQDTVQQVLGGRLVDVALCDVFVKDLVESKGVVFGLFR